MRLLISEFHSRRERNIAPATKLRSSWFACARQRQAPFFSVFVYGRTASADATRRGRRWMLGALTFELLFAAEPFDATAGIEELHRSILVEPVRFPSEPSISASACSFLRGLLEKSAADRLGSVSTAQVQQHGWFAAIDWEALARKELAPPYVPAPRADPLAHFPTHRSRSFVSDSDFRAPASVDHFDDPFARARRGAVDDWYFDRAATAAAATRRVAMAAEMDQRRAEGKSGVVLCG
eukprot:SAG11_NODE_511_length_8847_cov_3.611911_7_plen_238_part_00